MAERTDIEKQIAENAVASQTTAVDGTSSTEHSLPDQIAADRYLRSNRAVSRPGVGVRFRKIVPPGGA